MGVIVGIWKIGITIDVLMAFIGDYEITSKGRTIDDVVIDGFGLCAQGHLLLEVEMEQK